MNYYDGIDLPNLSQLVTGKWFDSTTVTLSSIYIIIMNN